MRILVVASHSGGHISPAIAFCQGLKDKNCEVEINFVSTDGEIEKKLLNSNIGFKVIFFKRGKITILNCYILVFLLFRAIVLINELKPNLIVGFGGFLSIPFIICAYFKRVPNFIHEQNIKMGSANRFLARFSDKIIFSFPGEQINDKIKNKSLILGIPLRKELRRIDKKEARNYFGFDTDRFTVLVTGGSQGSSKINTQITEVLKDESLSGIQVIHITGLFGYEKVLEEYKNLKIKYKIFTFFDRMDYAYSACDIVICRAGANTIAEIALFQVPSILIPYPYAKQHQLANARFLTDKNSAILIEDRECRDLILKEKIIDLMDNPAKLKQMSQVLGKINLGNARKEMAELAFKSLR